MGIAPLGGEVLLEFQQALSQKATSLAQAYGNLLLLSTRLGRSSNTELLADQVDASGKLQSKVDTMLEFVKCMRNPARTI